MLHDLKERPQETVDDFLKVDMYTSPNFNKDRRKFFFSSLLFCAVKKEQLMQIRYHDGKHPVERSVLGTPDCLVDYKTQLRKQAMREIDQRKKERRRQKRL